MSAQRETISARGEVLQFSRRIVEQLENTISLGELAARRTREAKSVQKTRQGEVYWRIQDSFFALCSPHVLLRNNWSIIKRTQWFKHQQSVIGAPDWKYDSKRTGLAKTLTKRSCHGARPSMFFFFLAHRNKMSCLGKHDFFFFSFIKLLQKRHFLARLHGFSPNLKSAEKMTQQQQQKKLPHLTWRTWRYFEKK